jgi:hypothetical protein
MPEQNEEPLKYLDLVLPALEDKDKNAFVAAQYQEVRKEVIDRLKELWTLEKFAFLGAAGIAAWLFTNTNNLGASAHIAWWLPLVFLLACLVRFLAGMRHLKDRTTKFLIKIEQRYLGEHGGWEKWFSDQPENETYAYTLAWGVAIAAAFALPLLQK